MTRLCDKRLPGEVYLFRRRARPKELHRPHRAQATREGGTGAPARRSAALEAGRPETASAHPGRRDRAPVQDAQARRGEDSSPESSSQDKGLPRGLRWNKGGGECWTAKAAAESQVDGGTRGPRTPGLGPAPPAALAWLGLGPASPAAWPRTAPPHLPGLALPCAGPPALASPGLTAGAAGPAGSGGPGRTAGLSRRRRTHLSYSCVIALARRCRAAELDFRVGTVHPIRGEEAAAAGPERRPRRVGFAFLALSRLGAGCAHWAPGLGRPLAGGSPVRGGTSGPGGGRRPLIGWRTGAGAGPTGPSGAGGGPPLRVAALRVAASEWRARRPTQTGVAARLPARTCRPSAGLRAPTRRPPGAESRRCCEVAALGRPLAGRAGPWRRPSALDDLALPPTHPSPVLLQGWSLPNR